MLDKHLHSLLADVFKKFNPLLVNFICCYNYTSTPISNIQLLPIAQIYDNHSLTFIKQKLTFSPLTPGNMFSSGTTTSSIRIMPVKDARREYFPSIFGQSRPVMPFSIRKPRMCPSSHLAQTRTTSAMGEFVILK